VTTFTSRFLSADIWWVSVRIEILNRYYQNVLAYVFLLRRSPVSHRAPVSSIGQSASDGLHTPQRSHFGTPLDAAIVSIQWSSFLINHRHERRIYRKSSHCTVTAIEITSILAKRTGRTYTVCDGANCTIGIPLAPAYLQVDELAFEIRSIANDEASFTWQGQKARSHLYGRTPHTFCHLLHYRKTRSFLGSRQSICHSRLVSLRNCHGSTDSFWISPLASDAAGAFLINLFNGAPLLVAVGIGIGNTLEAHVGSFLLKRNGFSYALDHLRDVLLLVLLITPLSAFISATIGVSSLLLGEVISPPSHVSTWSAWWIGDMISILILTPFILIWSTTYVAFPPLIWVALRFGPRGALLSMVAVSSLAIVGAIRGSVSFSTGERVSAYSYYSVLWAS
jgi:MASE1